MTDNLISNDGDESQFSRTANTTLPKPSGLASHDHSGLAVDVPCGGQGAAFDRAAKARKEAGQMSIDQSPRVFEYEIRDRLSRDDSFGAIQQIAAELAMVMEWGRNGFPVWRKATDDRLGMLEQHAHEPQEIAPRVEAVLREWGYRAWDFAGKEGSSSVTVKMTGDMLEIPIDAGRVEDFEGDGPPFPPVVNVCGYCRAEIPGDMEAMREHVRRAHNGTGKPVPFLDPTPAEQKAGFDAIAASPRPTTVQIKAMLEQMDHICIKIAGDYPHYGMDLRAMIGIVDRMGVEMIRLDGELAEVSAVAESLLVPPDNVAELMAVAGQWLEKYAPFCNRTGESDLIANMRAIILDYGRQASEARQLMADLRDALTNKLVLHPADRERAINDLEIILGVPVAKRFRESVVDIVAAALGFEVAK